jgi:pyrroline-5-carboxylate reductase
VSIAADAPRRLWLIGCGNMGGAMLSRWIDRGVVRGDAVDVVNRHDRDLPDGVRQARALPDGPSPDAVMLAMKPQQLDEIVAIHGERIRQAPVLRSSAQCRTCPSRSAKAWSRCMPTAHRHPPGTRWRR